MTNLNDLVTTVKSYFTNQRTPQTYSDADYLNFVILGCKRFYCDTGKEDSWVAEFNVDQLSRDLNTLELEYCIKSSQIEVLKNIRNAWNTLVSYTTNALTIANAFKPFEFLTKQITELELELTDKFHKLIDVSTASEINEVDTTQIDVTYG